MVKNDPQTHTIAKTKGWDPAYHLVLSYNSQKNRTGTSQLKIFLNEFFWQVSDMTPVVKILVRGGFRGMGIKGKSPGHMDFVRKNEKHIYFMWKSFWSQVLLYIQWI